MSAESSITSNPTIVGTAETRVLQSRKDPELQSYNDNIVAQLERLILKKREEIVRPQCKVAIRTAVACMTAMLRDAIVFRDRTMYPKPRTTAIVTRHVTDVMYHYLATEAP